jgi:hypothetical protein
LALLPYLTRAGSLPCRAAGMSGSCSRRAAGPGWRCWALGLVLTHAALCGPAGRVRPAHQADVHRAPAGAHSHARHVRRAVGAGAAALAAARWCGPNAGAAAATAYAARAGCGAATQAVGRPVRPLPPPRVTRPPLEVGCGGSIEQLRGELVRMGLRGSLCERAGKDLTGERNGA